MEIRFVVVAEVDTEARSEDIAPSIHETILDVLSSDLVRDRDEQPGNYQIVDWGIEPYVGG